MKKPPLRRRSKRAKPSGTDGLLKRINATPISGEDLMALSEAVHELPEDLRGFEGVVASGARIFGPDLEKVSSAQFRLTALAMIVEQGHLPGWVKPKDSDGGRLTNEILFHAAGATPLRQVSNDLRFRRADLLKTAFQMYEEKNRSQ